MKRYGEQRYLESFRVEGIDGSASPRTDATAEKVEGYGVVHSEWNSSPLVSNTTRRGKKGDAHAGHLRPDPHRFPIALRQQLRSEPERLATARYIPLCP
jgi:hypothetical protein